MRPWVRTLVAALALSVGALGACSSDDGKRPSLLADSDASFAPPPPDAAIYGDATAPSIDAGTVVDDAGGVGVVHDYAGECVNGQIPIWHFHDFKTHTPGDSHILMLARTAKTQAGLATAQEVRLADVRGPDLTSWTGVDVEPKLKSIGKTSEAWLRVTHVFFATDAGTPEIKESRQLYDCVMGF